MTIFDVIISGLTFIAFFIGLALFIRPSTHRFNNRLLGAAYLILSGFFSYMILRSTGLLVKFPFLLRLMSPYVYLVGPLFYFYLRNEIYQRRSLSKLDLLHFLPALLHFLDLFPFYFFTDFETKQQIAEQISENVNSLFREGGGVIPISYHYVLRTLSLVIYALVIGRLVFFSNLQISTVTGYKWLRVVAITYFSNVLIFVAMVIAGFYLFDPKLVAFDGAFITISLSLLIILVFGIYLFSNFAYQILPNQSDEYSQSDGQLAQEREEDTNTTKEYLNEKYGDNKGKQLAAEIQALISDPQVFRNPDLKVSDISTALGLPVRDISFLVSTYLNTRVSELVNIARVEEAKRLMDSDKHISKTLDAIGNEAGFNSRSTYYRIFKQIENCTPNEYLQQRQQK